MITKLMFFIYTLVCFYTILRNTPSDLKEPPLLATLVNLSKNIPWHFELHVGRLLEPVDCSFLSDL